MLQHIRSIIQVTWRRCDNVSGTSCKLLAEDLTTYQERVASHLKKMLQRIRNIWQVTWRRVYNVSGTSCKLLTEDVTTYQEHLWTSDKLLECNVTTYQEHLESDLQNMLQRIRIHHAGPLNPPHVPAPCPQVLPCEGLYIMFSNVIHHAGPLNPPRVPAPCPQVLL